MIFDRGLRRSLVALIAFTMPACADTLGPVDATDVPKRWPPGPLRDFLEGLQAPDFPYVDGAPTSCCGAGDVVDTKFKVEPGDEKHPQDTWYAMMLVLPDDVTAHPLQVSIDIASLAPNAEITVFPWKDPPELKARTINRARTFLKRHLPA
jgi:hypothetical protein